PPRKKAKSGELVESQTDIASSGVIRFNEYANRIVERGFFSDEIEVLGSRWTLLVKKSASSHLGVYLVHRTYETRPWSIDVAAQFNLIGTGEEGNREFELKNTFHNGHTRAGFDEMIKWNDLVDKEKGFVNERCHIVIEAWITLSNIVGISSVIDFTNPEDPRLDISFLLNAEKLYSSKQILAVHSPVFNAMFFGNFTEKDKKEVELKNVD
ncbi:hypothetical protein PMAYCL1PPCAC_25294, partial [Pristionchus mayeri]